MKRQGTGIAVDQLQAALIRSLKESVEETVSSVCGSFRHEHTAGRAADDSGGYDVYYNDCRRLVDYIQQTMEVSPDFEEQMDRIILACHSGATERVLNSVVTKQLWFHRRGDVLPSLQMRNSNKKVSIRGSSIPTRAAVNNKGTREASVSSSQSLTRIATRTSTVLPAMCTRSGFGTKRAMKGSVYDAQPSKRRRKSAARDTLDEEEKKKEKEDGLLSFKDAIGKLCYPDRRTPTETKFFKDRLRKSIQFVDALLCKPPQGKLCGRECKKIRAQICSSSTPCKNKMCRIWHDVEVHTDRCENLQCEFKNRILLRETMHKLDMKERQLAGIMVAFESKQKELKEAADDDKDAVKNDIAGLKYDLEDCDSELDVLEMHKKIFWGILNEIGINVSDDVVDNFPDFGTHYNDKKEPRKARKAVAATATRLSSASSGISRAAARQTSAGLQGDDDENEAIADDAEDTVRRSSSSWRHSAPSRHENDDKTKGEVISGDEDMKVEDKMVHHRDPIGDDPPLPRAGPPPFRQNPEVDLVGLDSLADNVEAPVVAANTEPTRKVKPSALNVSTEEQLAESMQRESGGLFNKQEHDEVQS